MTDCSNAEGHWDDTVKIKDKKTGLEETLWQVIQSQICEIRQM